MGSTLATAAAAWIAGRMPFVPVTSPTCRTVHGPPSSSSISARLAVGVTVGDDHDRAGGQRPRPIGEGHADGDGVGADSDDVVAADEVEPPAVQALLAAATVAGG